MQQTEPWKNVLIFFLCISLPQLAGGLGALVTADSVNTWYTEINKPSFTPPGWIFPVVWPALYFMMGLASFLIWRSGALQTAGKDAVRFALIIYGIHLLLNTLWSFLFFGLQNPGLAFIEIILLWGFIAWLIFLFYRIRASAGILLIPYLIWVTFATVLNGTIYFMN